MSLNLKRLKEAVKVVTQVHKEGYAFLWSQKQGFLVLFSKSVLFAMGLVFIAQYVTYFDEASKFLRFTTQEEIVSQLLTCSLLPVLLNLSQAIVFQRPLQTTFFALLVSPRCLGIALLLIMSNILFERAKADDILSVLTTFLMFIVNIFIPMLATDQALRSPRAYAQWLGPRAALLILNCSVSFCIALGVALIPSMTTFWGLSYLPESFSEKLSPAVFNFIFFPEQGVYLVLAVTICWPLFVVPLAAAYRRLGMQ